jgi:hypothetical protein
MTGLNECRIYPKKVLSAALKPGGAETIESYLPDSFKEIILFTKIYKTSKNGKARPY